MDPAYLHKRVVNLTDEELATLGFLSEIEPLRHYAHVLRGTIRKIEVHLNIPTKTAHGVFGTPLNAVWDTVAPQILESMKARGLEYSALKTVRFSTVEDGKEEIYSPVVGLDGPPLMSVKDNNSPKFGLNYFFNTGLGIHIGSQTTRRVVRVTGGFSGAFVKGASPSL
ncbi:hypothetical protein C8Q79DRAFT_1107188 [Trametes meyenii]|nr:hypothetical protein C8Q79DRAFT_1107188 [Trametes meyenii]